MRKFVIVLITTCMLIGLMSVCIACGGDDETGGSASTGPGELPILHEDDQWEYRAINDDIEYHLTLTVTDVGKNYSMKMKMDPPILGDIDESIAEFDKKLLLPVLMNISIDDPEIGMTFDMTIETSYKLSDDRWPLEVGKEVEVIETSTTSMDLAGEAMDETETITSMYKIEAIENITVQAGTFECYKIVKSNESGEIELTKWYSDEVKAKVKEIDHEMGETQELISYSVK